MKCILVHVKRSYNYMITFILMGKKNQNTKSCEMEYVIGGEKKLTRKLSNRNLRTMTNHQAEYASQS
jgi:hypothetical protein